MSIGCATNATKHSSRIEYLLSWREFWHILHTLRNMSKFGQLLKPGACKCEYVSSADWAGTQTRKGKRISQGSDLQQGA